MIGSLEICITLPAVGQIRRRSGYKDPGKIIRLKQALREIGARGDLNVLRRYKTGGLSSDEVMEYFKKGTDLNVDHDLLRQPLYESFRTWIEDHYPNPRTRRNRLGVLDSWRRKDPRADDYETRDLPRILKGYRKSQLRAGQLSPYSHLWNLSKTFLKDMMEEGEDSELYRKLKKLGNYTVSERNRNPSGHSYNPFSSPSELQKCIVSLNKSQKKAGLEPLAKDLEAWIWFMCTTGIGRSEVQDGISEHSLTAILVEGRKTQTRERLVPRYLNVPDFDFPSRHRVSYWMNKLGGRTERDCRRTYSVWLKKAGIDDLHVASYMGHIPSTMTQRYQRQDQLVWIKDDLPKLRNYIGESVNSPESELGIQPFQPLDDPSQIGEAVQNLTHADIRDILNEYLTQWYRHGWLRQPYQLNPDSRLFYVPDVDAVVQP